MGNEKVKVVMRYIVENIAGGCFLKDEALVNKTFQLANQLVSHFDYFIEVIKINWYRKSPSGGISSYIVPRFEIVIKFRESGGAFFLCKEYTLNVTWAYRENKLIWEEDKKRFPTQKDYPFPVLEIENAALKTFSRIMEDEVKKFKKQLARASLSVGRTWRRIKVS